MKNNEINKKREKREKNTEGTGIWGEKRKKQEKKNTKIRTRKIVGKEKWGVGEEGEGRIAH